MIGYVDAFASALFHLALCFDNQNNHEQALKSGLEAQNTFRDLGDILNMLKTIIDNVKRYQKLFLFDKACKMLEKYSILVKEMEGSEISTRFHVFLV